MAGSKQKILDLLELNSALMPSELAAQSGYSRQQIQTQLIKLLNQDKIQKSGSPPRVYYSLKSKPQTSSQLTVAQREFLIANYLYITPSGVLETGETGFIDWAERTGQKQDIQKLAEQYILIREKANKDFGNNTYLEGYKINTEFEEDYLDGIFYSDYYSLPQFGKTRLGQLMFTAKQSQNVALIKSITSMVKDAILTIITANSVNGIAFIPPSVPRRMQFMSRFATELDLRKPQILFLKHYFDVIVPQKTLKTSAERIQNARETILVAQGQADKIRGSNILLIDDASGSGATLNEAASKLKSEGANKVFGYSITGSLNGFEVIQEA